MNERLDRRCRTEKGCDDDGLYGRRRRRQRQFQLTDRPRHRVWSLSACPAMTTTARRGVIRRSRSRPSRLSRPLREKAVAALRLRPLPSVLRPTPTGLWPLFLRPSARVEMKLRRCLPQVEQLKIIVMCRFSALQESPCFESLGDYPLENTASLQLKFQPIF